MKKILSCLLISSAVICLGYTSEDSAMANRLADADIIVSHKNNLDAYRLDDTVTRQEVIGMSLKLRGVALPSNYSCKGYFSDATFDSSSADAWVCRAVELAADRGLVTRDNTTTRPRDKITKAEALAIVWKAADMDITAGTGDVTFFDAAGQPAAEWQENLLHSALDAGVITVAQSGTSAAPQLLWKHNNLASRKEVFAIISTLLSLKNAGDQVPYLTFSGEAQYTPGVTKIISTDLSMIKNLQDKNFDQAVMALNPTPIDYRSEGNTLFVMQKSPEKWGAVKYSSISTVLGKVIQKYSSYNPYENAIRAMLQRFNLKSEADFYALPYGVIWEQTRDFVERYFMEEFSNARIVYPAGSTIVP